MMLVTGLSTKHPEFSCVVDAGNDADAFRMVEQCWNGQFDDKVKLYQEGKHFYLLLSGYHDAELDFNGDDVIPHRCGYVLEVKPVLKTGVITFS